MIHLCIVEAASLQVHLEGRGRTQHIISEGVINVKTWRKLNQLEPGGKYVSHCSDRVLAKRAGCLSVSLDMTSSSVLLL